jgi:beta-fructofuranosidase
MTLRLPDKWLWDFWFAQDGPDYHLFYLQALRSLGNPDLRHWHTSIGHAVSQDLLHWQVLPDALAPSSVGEPSPADTPAFDNSQTWTGSVIGHAGLWYLFYTGLSRAENGRVQRVGLATSQDLVHWEKHPNNPLLTADPTWYEQYDPQATSWAEESWRDPYVFQHPETGDFHMFICARVNYGPRDRRGVVGHARSPDLVHWQALPPVSAPGDFGQLEVPQPVAIGGRYVLLFCTAATTHAADWQSRTGLAPVMGTHYLVADNPLGPYRLSTPRFLAGDAHGSLYAGKLVQAPGGGWVFLAFRNVDEAGNFYGELIDPLPVDVDPAGELSLRLG